MKKTISKEEINELPIVTFPGTIKLITNPAERREAVSELMKEEVIGFDTECRPAFRKGESYPISLLQLSTKDTAYLFRLNKVKFAGELVDLMASEKVKKVGVAVHDDIKGLQKLSPFKAGGFVEIAELAKSHEIIKLGLRSLTGIMLGKRLSKKAQLSNWAINRLSTAQMEYAATDAWIGLELYNAFSDLDK